MTTALARLQGVAALGVLVIVAGCASAPVASSPTTSHGSQPARQSMPASAAPPTPTPSVPTFVFANLAGSYLDYTSTVTFVSASGTVIGAFQCTNSASTCDQPVTDTDNYIGGSTALLASDEIPETGGGVAVDGYSVLEKDGTVETVAASLTQLLDLVVDGAPGVFLVGPDTLFATIDAADGAVDFDQIELATGTVDQLISAGPLSSSGSFLFQAENIDPSLHLISFLVSDATLNGRPLSGVEVAVLNLETEGITVRDVPAAAADDLQPFEGSYTGLVTADGSLLAYGSGQVTNILNLNSGHDAVVPGAWTSDGEVNSVLYSPGDSYVALSGGNDDIEVAQTADGAVVRTISVPSDELDFMAPMGWAGSSSLAFVTNTTSVIGTFYPNTEIAHVLSLPSGGVDNVGSGLGELMAVLP
ncbi:MAG: hypothetical protein ACLQGJ_03860 [Candidatus Dormibacteria bacterium]